MSEMKDKVINIPEMQLQAQIHNIIRECSAAKFFGTDGKSYHDETLNNVVAAVYEVIKKKREFTISERLESTTFSMEDYKTFQGNIGKAGYYIWGGIDAVQKDLKLDCGVIIETGDAKHVINFNYKVTPVTKWVEFSQEEALKESKVIENHLRKVLGL